jgi:small subunit ribosomal protein S3
MGQKIHPIGYRIGVIRDADSKWYADKQYAAFVKEDYDIRRMINTRKWGAQNPTAAIAKIEIERQANRIRVTVHTAKPGIIIGRQGAGIDLLKSDLEKMTSKNMQVNVQEIRHLETNAQLVAESIAQQIEKRIGYKRAMRQAVTRAMKLGVRGIRCQVSGRLGGAEMARREQDRLGKIPLQTLRADIDYGFDEALTQYGHIGVKVWIYKGDILPGARKPVETPGAPRSRGEGDDDRGRRRDNRDRSGGDRGGRDGRSGGGDRGGRGGSGGGPRGGRGRNEPSGTFTEGGSYTTAPVENTETTGGTQ